ncbi:MAG: PQQ-binding-like beta-propeller repeat protein [Cellulomonas sp.]|uniref:outer membrane protein assembly factor BamB family protein n=1 Tax=Cellulomonas sp. TaxID=40001 RepID=UPI0019DD5452|nr:PQQ-binding-like beta-propeller repeat protein [Cellulomonas sp.]MBF0688038.1 PQQ-binding-like beta-propeller repeat protein [Cellulomonas sp.]
MARARRVDVELQQAAPDAAGPGSAVPGAPPAAGSSAARRRRWWLAVPIAAVLALVVGQAVVDRRERAALAELAAVPSVLAPLDGPPVVAWELDEGTHLGGSALVGSVLVATHRTPDRTVVLEGRDVATGDRLWALDVVEPSADRTSEAQVDPASCAAVPELPGRVACLVTNGGFDVVDGDWASVPATSTRLLVLDATDGAVVVEREVPTSARWLTPSGDDVLLVGLVDGTLHVRSQALLDDTEHWHVTVDVATDDGPLTLGESALVDARTFAVGHGDAVTLVSTDGEVLRTVDMSPESALTGQATTTRLELSTALGAAVIGGESSTTVVSATGEVPLDGNPLPVVVDDGSVPGLVLTRTPVLQAWDARDGEARWEGGVVDAQDATVLDGRVHVGTSAWLVTFDGETGAELWRWARPTATGAPLTDGRYLYLLGMRGPRHSAPYDLVALHVADGSEAWRTPLPQMTWLQVLHRLLLARSFEPETQEESYSVLR